MCSDKPQPNKNSQSDKQKLQLSKDENHPSTKYEHNNLSEVEDKEYFLRKAFLRDEWEGCSLVFEYYYLPLCSHAIRFVHSRMYAEDIVSDVFLTFWQKRHFERVKTSYRTYLFQAVRNQALNFIRKEFGKESLLPVEDLILSGTMSPEAQMMYDQFYHKVQEGIHRLPPKCKKVFVMSRFEDKPLKEIASIHNISARTVEGHINKALKIMRKALDYMHD